MDQLKRKLFEKEKNKKHWNSRGNSWPKGLLHSIFSFYRYININFRCNSTHINWDWSCVCLFFEISFPASIFRQYRKLISWVPLHWQKTSLSSNWADMIGLVSSFLFSSHTSVFVWEYSLISFRDEKRIACFKIKLFSIYSYAPSSQYIYIYIYTK